MTPTGTPNLHPERSLLRCPSNGGTVRSALRVGAVVLGAALGMVAGFAVAVLLWVFFVEGGPEVPIGGLLAFLVVTVPTGFVAGGVVGWRLSRILAADT
jgi:hypothetical protein